MTVFDVSDDRLLALWDNGPEGRMRGNPTPSSLGRISTGLRAVGAR
jgi:hypothetical protein